MGNLRAQKNHAFLLRIFKELLNLHPESTLLLVGNGPLKEKITEQIHQLNLTENVLMLGDRPDVRLLLQAMDLIVMPSLHEGLPVTLIEAQAAGLHCLVADNISDEVSVTDQIHYCSIAKTPKFWAKKIMGFHPSRQRQVTTSLIKNAGFDVKTVAKSLTKFYLNCHSQ